MSRMTTRWNLHFKHTAQFPALFADRQKKPNARPYTPFRGYNCPVSIVALGEKHTALRWLFRRA